MRVCIPTTDDSGLSSRLSPHFGKAPYYTIVDTDTWVVDALANDNVRHAHGECRPLAGLEGRGVDAVVCLGLGRNALVRLRSARVPVHVASDRAVSEALDAFLAGDLPELTSEEACHGAH